MRMKVFFPAYCWPRTQTLRDGVYSPRHCTETREPERQGLERRHRHPVVFAYLSAGRQGLGSAGTVDSSPLPAPGKYEALPGGGCIDTVLCCPWLFNHF